jgi:hypothetical protein
MNNPIFTDQQGTVHVHANGVEELDPADSTRTVRVYGTVDVSMDVDADGNVVKVYSVNLSDYDPSEGIDAWEDDGTLDGWRRSSHAEYAAFQAAVIARIDEDAACNTCGGTGKWETTLKDDEDDD